MTRKEIKKEMVAMFHAGEIVDLNSKDAVSTLYASIDRFSMIIEKFEGYKTVVDIGALGCILLKYLHKWGHECIAVDFFDEDSEQANATRAMGFEYVSCNVEIDALPFDTDSVDAISCCQCLEHFTYAHLPTMKEFYRCLRSEGIVEVDVPNAACFRNRVRMLRGKHITWDYERHYLDPKPILYKGQSFFPHRHNREFVYSDLELLFERAGFEEVEVSFIKSRRHREGLEKLKNLGTGLKDSVPSFRKTLMGYGRKL